MVKNQRFVYRVPVRFEFVLFHVEAGLASYTPFFHYYLRSYMFL